MAIGEAPQHSVALVRPTLVGRSSPTDPAIGKEHRHGALLTNK